MPRDNRRPPRDDPYDSLKNIHLDVHGIRKQVLDAIEKSQTAILNRLTAHLTRIEAKIDKLTPAPGGTVDTGALATAAKAAGTAIAESEAAIDEGKPTT